MFQDEVILKTITNVCHTLEEMPHFSTLFASVFVFALLIDDILVNGGPWASPALEKLDEVHDAEIYRAIVTSMQEWQIRQNLKKGHREKRQTSSICYKGLGCFASIGPYAYIDVLPNTPEEISTLFYFYPGHKSRKNGFTQSEISYGNISEAFKWAEQGFNNSLPTKVLIHGFGSDCTHIWVYELRSALMAVDEMNIICIDWSKGAALPNYVKAAANTRLVGKQLAILLRGLMKYAGLLPKDVHLIGFSLGAHVAGFTGAELGNLSRITGLDPAGPLFESQDPRARLDETDAEFVDVIHSNGENLILGGLGCWQPLGHVDFYPNGGRMQKGCSNIFVGAVSDIIWSSAIEGRSLCNHRRSYKFFTDSISPRCHFPAFSCESYEAFLEGRCFPCTDEENCGNMGYYADRAKGRGKLFLITRDEEPFCAHQYHVKIESSPSEFPITSYGKIQITLVGDSDLNETFIMTRKDDEEIKLGRSISRILVPHPVLAEPTHIQVLYTAYSGWLSSGLGYWKIDKITLSDSYGKSSSICKRSLILESGIPITLPLYPGQCNLPAGKSNNTWNESLKNSTLEDTSNLIPTSIIKIGNELIARNKSEINLVDAVELFGSIPWQQLSYEKNNRVDDDKENSRALNSRVVEPDDDLYTRETALSEETLKEIVEPVLKPTTKKIGRSHDPDKAKHEISEPILGPTTNRANSPVKDSSTKKELRLYEFFEDDWVPSAKVQNEQISRDKWKRQDDSILKYNNISSTAAPKLNLLTMTVQFIPQRLTKMFEDAEKYARETILPFVSAHTPKIIRDFITPEVKLKYVPLHFDNEHEDVSYSIASHGDNPQSGRNLNSPVDSDKHVDITATPYTHIQKILKRGEALALVYPETTTNHLPTVATEQSTKESETKENKTQEIYVDLPVFDKDYKSVKYIPLDNNENARKK